ncbi:hypothetical protein FIBSPDRAFT_414298 [Athelia psychrophila]|uniref:Uncharacterized protein n=1 Tax=Athelia psychrophila TaxID=1759441 RepID=A0A167UUL0_9AGAM|nr:hypothetical protein FIBSPDRAFT_414298 [Fibularhizoctonia sp. CBS 109695]
MPKLGNSEIPRCHIPHQTFAGRRAEHGCRVIVAVGSAEPLLVVLREADDGVAEEIRSVLACRNACRCAQAHSGRVIVDSLSITHVWIGCQHDKIAAMNLRWHNHYQACCFVGVRYRLATCLVTWLPRALCISPADPTPVIGLFVLPYAEILANSSSGLGIHPSTQPGKAASYRARLLSMFFICCRWHVSLEVCHESRSAAIALFKKENRIS